MGTIRIAGTRVTLDVLVNAFNRGASAEEISCQFDVLTLADVYAAIAYYLSNQVKIDDYMAASERHTAILKNQLEADSSNIELRKRLIARRSSVAYA